MNTEEKLFRDRLEKSLGKYCPNITALNQISTYIFREAVDVVRKSGDINKVLTGTEINSDMETLSFIRAVKDLSTFSSQVIIDEAFKKAFQEVKNTIPLVERKEVINKSNSTVITKGKISNLSKNIAEFDIDISSIPKVSVQVNPDVPTVERTVRNESVSNVFTGDFEIDLDDVNQRTVRNFVSDDTENDSDKDPDFTTDGSAFSEGVYSDSFSIDVGLDY